MASEMILHDSLLVLILAFQVSTMLGLGLSLTTRQIVEPLRNLRRLAWSLVASYIVVPLIAFGVATAFALEAPLQIGLLLISMAAGAEAGPIAVRRTCSVPRLGRPVHLYPGEVRHRRTAVRIPRKMWSGGGGQPGTVKSTGMTLATRPQLA